MADDEVPIPAPDRRALIKAIGLDLTRLDRHARAAVEALCEEVLALRDENEHLQVQLQESRLLADHDGLCPVFNRRAFEREVRREIALAGRFHTPLSLIFVDLDRFKEVNDLFGHTIGDEVLLRVAHILTRNTRETDIVGRLGGDEFGIVLSQATAQDSLRKAGQLAQMIDSLVVRDDADGGVHEVRLGGSCGVVQWADGQSESDLIALADQAMFIEKARRKGNAPQHR
jgi:diguanylate cyclase (GGDEF)-like protein